MLTKELKLGITETIEILKLADKKEIDKIPKKFMNFLNEHADKEYKFEIGNEISLKNLKLRKETKNILAIIAYNYWCDTPEKKSKFNELLNNNQKIYEEKLRNQYNPDNLFKNKKQVNQNKNDSTALVKYKQSFFTKLFNKVKSLFRKSE